MGKIMKKGRSNYSYSFQCNPSQVNQIIQNYLMTEKFQPTVRKGENCYMFKGAYYRYFNYSIQGNVVNIQAWFSGAFHDIPVEQSATTLYNYTVGLAIKNYQDSLKKLFSQLEPLQNQSGPSQNMNQSNNEDMNGNNNFNGNMNNNMNGNNNFNGNMNNNMNGNNNFNGNMNNNINGNNNFNGNMNNNMNGNNNFNGNMNQNFQNNNQSNDSTPVILLVVSIVALILAIFGGFYIVIPMSIICLSLSIPKIKSSTNSAIPIITIVLSILTLVVEAFLILLSFLYV